MEQSLRKSVFEFVKKRYNSEIEYLWQKFPGYAVFRHDDNRKWYGIVMNIPYRKLGVDKEGIVDILNVKLDDVLLRDLLIQQEGYFIGYHISRGSWISILLDGTVKMSEIENLIETSYKVTEPKAKKKKL